MLPSVFSPTYLHIVLSHSVLLALSSSICQMTTAVIVFYVHIAICGVHPPLEVLLGPTAFKMLCRCVMSYSGFWLIETCALQAHEVEKAAAHHSAGAALQEAEQPSCPASGQQLLWVLFMGGPSQPLPWGACRRGACHWRRALQGAASWTASSSSVHRGHTIAELTLSDSRPLYNTLRLIKSYLSAAYEEFVCTWAVSFRHLYLYPSSSWLSIVPVHVYANEKSLL